jgi:ankyrin repeat protein
MAGRVRRGVIRDAAYLLTPLEAAAAARHGEVVRLLVGNGAELNDTNFPVLFCLAQGSGAADIVSFLQELAPPGVVFECDGVHLPL